MAEVETKHCKKCDTVKPIDAFRTRADRAARRYKCIACERRYNRIYGRNRDPEARRAYAREYYHSSVKSPEHHAKRKCKKYGLTPSEFAEINEKQRGLCAICGQRPASGKALHIDHCHDTGRVRGLLCGSCNLGLGKLGDTAEAIERALIYLRQ